MTQGDYKVGEKIGTA